MLLDTRSILKANRVAEKTGEPCESYEDIAYHSLGSRGRSLVNVNVFSLQIGICTVFLHYIAENAYAIYPGLSVKGKPPAPLAAAASPSAISTSAPPANLLPPSLSRHSVCLMYGRLRVSNGMPKRCHALAFSQYRCIKVCPRRGGERSYCMTRAHRPTARTNVIDDCD